MPADTAIVQVTAPRLSAAQTASRRLPPAGVVWAALPHAPKLVATSAVLVTVNWWTIGWTLIVRACVVSGGTPLLAVSVTR